MSDYPPLDTALPGTIKDLIGMEDPKEDWDLPPLIFFMCTQDGDDSGKYNLHALAMPEALLALSPDPVPLLFSMGGALGVLTAPDPPLQLGGPIGSDEQVVAIIIRTEGWGLVGLSKEEMEAHIASGKRIVDHPAAIEGKVFTGYSPATGAIASIWHRNVPAEEQPELGGSSLDGRVARAAQSIYDGAAMRWNR